MNTTKIICLCFLVFLSLPVSLPAQANKEALAKAQFMLRQMNAEMNQLRAANKKLLSEKSAMEKEKTGLQKKHDKFMNKSAKTKNLMKGKFAELKNRYKEEVLAHKETKNQLSVMRNENKTISEVSNQQSHKIEICAENNKKLFDINQQLLVRFEDKSVWDSLIQAEPFSQLSQVEIENLVDDYQYSMDNLRVDKNM